MLKAGSACKILLISTGSYGQNTNNSSVLRIIRLASGNPDPVNMTLIEAAVWLVADMSCSCNGSETAQAFPFRVSRR
jgi:hypothetical protein